MGRIDEIIYKAKLQSNDIQGGRLKDESWLIYLNEALVQLNLEFKFKFKTASISISNFEASLPDDFLVVKSLYLDNKEVYYTSYDEVIKRRGFAYARGLCYAIEGNKIYTNFNGNATLVYYSKDLTIDDIPPVFDSLISDYLTWTFYKIFYPELEEHWFNIYQRNKYNLRANILNLETKKL